LSGEAIEEGPEARYAALGFPKIEESMNEDLVRKKPQSYGCLELEHHGKITETKLTTLSILCPSPVIESASSRPDADFIRDVNSGVVGRERANIPKAVYHQFEKPDNSN
jgi:hypothetical protein